MGSPEDLNSRRPEIEEQHLVVDCPICNAKALKTTWIVGRLTLWRIDCRNCSFLEDGHSLLTDGTQN